MVRRADDAGNGWSGRDHGGLSMTVRFTPAQPMMQLVRRPAVTVPLAGLLGGLTVLALPPFSLPPFLVLGIGGFYRLLQGVEPARAALTGWNFGLGFFLAGTYWIGESFLVDADRFGWMAVPAVGGLAAFLALFVAAPAWLFARLGIGGVAGGPVFALLWTGSEWLRGHLLTGFPWNLAAYAWTEHQAPRQLAALVGSYGLSLLTVLAAALLPLCLLAPSRRDRRRARMTTILLLAALAAGALRLPSTGEGTAVRAMVRMVQGNVPQAGKWLPEQRAATVERYLDLSFGPGRYDLLLWPETAYPGFLDEDGRTLARIGAQLPPGARLLAGTPRRTREPEGPALWNAVVAIDRAGRVEAAYAKHHLVPFGEYVPLRWLLPFDRFVAGFGEFSAGPGPRTVRLGDWAAGIAICYEAIFPGELVDRSDRPDWIFNPTNDAWFGMSIGPSQHLGAARMRAVEEGLPVVRAANTGISAVIDGYGAIRASLPLNRTGIIDAPIPPALPPTPYGRYGDLLLVPLALAAVLLAGLLGGRRDRQPRRAATGNPTVGSAARRSAPPPASPDPGRR